MRKHSKERPPPLLADLYGAPPMGPFLRDYGIYIPQLLCLSPSSAANIQTATEQMDPGMNKK